MESSVAAAEASGTVSETLAAPWLLPSAAAASILLSSTALVAV